MSYPPYGGQQQPGAYYPPPPPAQPYYQPPLGADPNYYAGGTPPPQQPDYYGVYPQHQASGQFIPPAAGYGGNYGSPQPQYAPQPQYPPPTPGYAPPSPQSGQAPAPPPPARPPPVAPASNATAPQWNNSFEKPPASNDNNLSVADATQTPTNPIPAAIGGAVPAKPVLNLTHSRPPIDRARVKAILKEQGFTDKEILEATNEHVNHSVSLTASNDEVLEQGGLPLLAFFGFVKYILLVSVLVTVLQIIFYIVISAAKPRTFTPNYTTNATWYSDFFISTFPVPNQTFWKVVNSILIALIFLSGPLYIVWAKYGSALTQEDLDSLEQENEDKIVRFIGVEGDIDVGAHYRTMTSLVLRRLFSLLIFTIFVVAQVLISLYLTQLNNSATQAAKEAAKSGQDAGTFGGGAGTVSIGVAAGVAIVTVLLNFIFSFVSRWTTEFEKHTSLAVSITMNTLKQVLFMFANLMAVYGAKEYNQASLVRCVYDIIGEQFLMILLLETFLVPIITIASAVYFNQTFRWWADCSGSINGDNANLPQFDLTTFYIKGFYKVYLMTMSMVVFPLSCILCMVGIFFDWWVYKFLAFKVCGKPRKSRGAMKNTVAAGLMAAVAIALATPYAGAGFVLSGSTGQMTTRNSCLFPI